MQINQSYALYNFEDNFCVYNPNAIALNANLLE